MVIVSRCQLVIVFFLILFLNRYALGGQTVVRCLELQFVREKFAPSRISGLVVEFRA